MTNPSERSFSQSPDFYPRSIHEGLKNTSNYLRLNNLIKIPEYRKAGFELFTNPPENTLALTITRIDRVSGIIIKPAIPQGFSEPLVIISFIDPKDTSDIIYFNRNGHALKEVTKNVNGKIQSSYSYPNKEDYGRINEALDRLESGIFQIA